MKFKKKRLNVHLAENKPSIGYQLLSYCNYVIAKWGYGRIQERISSLSPLLPTATATETGTASSFYSNQCPLQLGTDFVNNLHELNIFLLCMQFSVVQFKPKPVSLKINKTIAQMKLYHTITHSLRGILIKCWLFDTRPKNNNIILSIIIGLEDFQFY